MKLLATKTIKMKKTKPSKAQYYEDDEPGLESIAIPYEDNLALKKLLNELELSGKALARAQEPALPYTEIRKLKKSRCLPLIWDGWRAAVKTIGVENPDAEVWLHNGFMDELGELPSSLEVEAAMTFMNERCEQYCFAQFGAFEVGSPQDLKKFEAVVMQMREPIPDLNTVVARYELVCERKRHTQRLCENWGHQRRHRRGGKPTR
jgi:hypothetical protein